MKVENYLNKNTRIYMMILLISLSIIILGGTSYALVQRVLVGNNTYSLQTGNFLVEFSSDDTVTLTNNIPVYDNIGLKSENEFSFQVTNTGNYNASYSIRIEDNSESNIKEAIRYAVNYGDGYSYDNIHALSNNSYIIQNKGLSQGNTDSYSVKFWLDIDATEQYVNDTFLGKIVIEATQEEYKYAPNVLDAIYSLEDKEGLESIGSNQEYRYSGATPSNYVWFNCDDGYTSGDNHCEKWRIIGSFYNTYLNGVGSYRMLKIVRDASLTSNFPYNSNSGNLANYKGSSIETYLNNTYYNSFSTTTKNLVMNANWNIGTTSNTNTAVTSYNKETTLTHYNNLGLINASDFGYAGSSNLWNTALNTNSFTSSNNWLYQENNMVLNTPSLEGTNVYYLSTNGLTQGNTTTSYKVRPTLYLKPDVSIINGLGTSEEPYELAIKFPMEYGIKTEEKAQIVIYNLNGGEGNINPTRVGEAITSEMPLKDGYDFLGWATTSDAEEAEYIAGDIYSGNSITLYAVWNLLPVAPIINESVVAYSVSSLTTFTGGLVAVNTSGTLYNETDTTQEIREYRYSGPTVNNYVYFNCADTVDEYNYGDANYPYNETNCELWRIVGIFKNSSGEWNVKLMRNTVLQASELVSTYTYGGTTYNIQYSTDNIVYWNYKTSGTNNNDWTTAGLQYFLNIEQDTNGTSGYYSSITATSKSLIDDDYKYHLGNVVYGSSGDTTITAYDNERKTTVCASSVTSDSHSSNCYVWSGNQPNWNGAIGLLYPSDVGYAAHNSYWSATKLSVYSGSAVKASSWMMQNGTHSANEWLLSPSSNGSYSAMIWNLAGYLSSVGDVNSIHGVCARPVLNLKSETTSLAGRDGSINLPYVFIGR